LNWKDNWRHNAALIVASLANTIFCIATAPSLQEGAEKTPAFYQDIFLLLRVASNQFAAMALMTAACFIYNGLGASGSMQLARALEVLKCSAPGDWRDKLIKGVSIVLDFIRMRHPYGSEY
jgi:hypothetical protein